MPEIAKKAVLDLSQEKLLVDGAEFPWIISEEGPTLNDLCAQDAIPSITLTFFVDDVEVIPKSDSSECPRE